MRWLMVLLIGVICSASAFGQGVVSDVLSGKLVDPKVGAWAWYDLSEASSNETFLVRLAIVDEEKVGSKVGYWLEVEVVPMVGYRSVYKMLVTGPAGNPDNVHRLIQRDGVAPAQEVPMEKGKKSKSKDKEKDKDSSKIKRTLLNEEDVETKGGAVHAEHYEWNDGEKSEVWLNKDVRPMGIVRMQSASGELHLRNFGVGGDDARSVIDENPAQGAESKESKVKVEVHVDKES